MAGGTAMFLRDVEMSRGAGDRDQRVSIALRSTLIIVILSMYIEMVMSTVSNSLRTVPGPCL